MKLQISFGFGVEYRGDGSALLGHEQAAGMSKVTARATELFGGHTLVQTLGEWRDPDFNQVVAEAGCTISVLVKEEWALDRNIDEMVQQIKASLQQKAVAVTRTEVQFDIL